MIPVDSAKRLKFGDDDLLGREDFCKSLEKFLLVEKDYVSGGLVVSLNAGFGAGKSTFVEMWAEDLISRRQKGEFNPMPVLLNAWESDHCGDPLLSIMAGLLEAIDNWAGGDPPEKEGLTTAAKDLGWFFVGLASAFTGKHLGIDPVKGGDLAQAKKAARNKVPDYVAVYQHRIESLRKLKIELKKLFRGSSPKLIIFVDELDRCRPDYAISYLETIKHVFDVEGLIFVLAVDIDQLESSAKALFGVNLDFNNYYRKFSHRTFELPDPSESARRAMSKAYFKKYLDIDGSRMSLLPAEMHFVDHMSNLSEGLKLRPRQVQEAFRILGHLAATSEGEQRGRIFWALGCGTIFMSFLKVADKKIFEGIKRMTMRPAEVAALLFNSLEAKDAQWWTDLYITGVVDTSRKGWTLEEIIADINTKVPISSSPETISREFANAWGGGARFSRICARIDAANSLA